MSATELRQSKGRVRGILDIFQWLWNMANVEERKSLHLLFFLMFAVAILEVVSIGMVLPFITVLASPDILWDYAFVQNLAVGSGISEPSQLILPLTLLLILFSTISTLAKTYFAWRRNVFSHSVCVRVGSSLYERTLRSPYESHFLVNSSEFISAIVNKVPETTIGLTQPALTILSSMVTIIFVSCFVFFISPVAVIICVLVYGNLYLLVRVITRRKILENSIIIAKEYSQGQKLLQEGYGSIKDIYLTKSQTLHRQLFEESSRNLRLAQSQSMTVGNVPKYAIEGASIVVIAIIALIYAQEENGIIGALPLLGGVALSAQRLLPVFHQVFSGITQIATVSRSVDDIDKYMHTDLDTSTESIQPQPMDFVDSISFEDVQYTYPADTVAVLSGIDLSIRKGSIVGIVGESGSGKSTVIDLLLGLIHAESGDVLIDGKSLVSSGVAAWQSNISYVSQSVYLTDASVIDNIVFGSTHDLDLEYVWKVLNWAQLKDVVQSLPQGLSTHIGENGAKLSNGQKQRLGLARAFYRRTPVLVLDEATNGLDVKMEELIFSDLKRHYDNGTVILVSHQKSTIQKCDKLFYVEDGKVRVLKTDEYLRMNFPSS